MIQKERDCVVEIATTRRSPLEEIYKTGDFGTATEDRVIFQERRALTIVQIAAWQKHAEKTLVAIEKVADLRPSRTACSAIQSEQTVAIWVGPERWLLVEKASRDLYDSICSTLSSEEAAITDQSHSRCVLRLSGKGVRNVLRKGTTLDMDINYFKPQEARTTSLFHINGIIHCLSADCFDIYVARSFGCSFFEVITHAAMEYGYCVEMPI